MTACSAYPIDEQSGRSFCLDCWYSATDITIYITAGTRSVFLVERLGVSGVLPCLLHRRIEPLRTNSDEVFVYECRGMLSNDILATDPSLPRFERIPACSMTASTGRPRA